MALDLADVLQKAAEALAVLVVGGLSGWVSANARIDKKLDSHKKDLVAVVQAVEARAVALSSQAKAEAVRELERLGGELREDLERLEADLRLLEDRDVSGRVQSASDHTAAAQLARSLEEMRAQMRDTSATLYRVLGILQGKGVNI